MTEPPVTNRYLGTLVAAGLVFLIAGSLAAATVQSVLMLATIITWGYAGTLWARRTRNRGETNG